MDDFRAVIPAFYFVISDFYRVILAFYRVIPAFYRVIPAKAGIQRFADGAGLPRRPRGSHPRERGRPARRAALARVTLILAFSHEGRRDPPAALGA